MRSFVLQLWKKKSWIRIVRFGIARLKFVFVNYGRILGHIPMPTYVGRCGKRFSNLATNPNMKALSVRGGWTGRRSRAPMGDFTVAFGHEHPLVLIALFICPSRSRNRGLETKVRKRGPENEVCFFFFF